MYFRNSYNKSLQRSKNIFACLYSNKISLNFAAFLTDLFDWLMRCHLLLSHTETERIRRNNNKQHCIGQSNKAVKKAAKFKLILLLYKHANIYFDLCKLL